jgi:alcohol dehydrogenase
VRAVVMDGSGVPRVDELPDPVLPDAFGAVVKVDAAAICGSDMHFFDGDLPTVDGLAVGHEAIGTIVELGSAVRQFALGDRVMVSCVTGCGHCAGCGAGDPAICDTGCTLFGVGAGLGGGQADMLAVPNADANLGALPDDVSDEAALLLTDNLPTAWTAVRRGGVSAGQTVLVLGLGAVGLCAVRCALQLGPATVFAYDPVAGRRARAVGYGAVEVGDDTHADILDATGGRGVDVVIDAVATDRSLDAAFACVRAGGTVSVVGVHDLNPYPLPILTGVFRSITLRMSTAAVQSGWRELLPLVRAQKLDASDVFTHWLALADAPEAYALVAERTPECVKVMLTP